MNKAYLYKPKRKNVYFDKKTQRMLTRLCQTNFCSEAAMLRELVRIAYDETSKKGKR